LTQPGDRSRGIRYAMLGSAVFFTVGPFVSILADPPEPPATALLVIGWGIFAVVLRGLLTNAAFERTGLNLPYAGATIALVAIALVAQLAYATDAAIPLYYYAGVTAGRLGRERSAAGGIALSAVAATVGTGVADGDFWGALSLGVTVATLCLTVYTLAALGRSNRDLQAARTELAEMAVADERSRIARDLHDTLGHTLSLIALKSELAERVLETDPARAKAEIADVERVAREALTSVRETVSGYRQPTLAMELAGARAALLAAGIVGDVEPAPEALPRDVDAVLGWAVREGVTNILRHSGAGHARIRVLTGDDRRAVEVIDDGAGVTSGAPDGSGLAGLRERAALVGGELQAGPLAGGGFRLALSVPGPGAVARSGDPS